MAKRKKRNQIPQGEFEVDIIDLSHNGKGVAKLEEKAVFVAGALPQETVSIKFIKVKRSYSEAINISTIKHSKDRVTPKCQYFMLCGGCVLQHLEPKQQIVFKQKNLIEEFKKSGKIAISNKLEPLTDLIWGYRRKARLGVRVVDKKGGALVGFREIGSSFITVMDSCEVLHPKIGKKIKELRTLINTMIIGNKIAQIELAMGDNDCVLVFRNLEDLPESDVILLDEFGKQNDFFIYTQSGGPETVQPLNSQHQVQLNYKVHDISFDFNPNNFTQINSAMNIKMIDQALKYLNLRSTDRVLDLFCGLGNFTLPIAQKCQQVLGLEGSKSLVNDALNNARKNNINNAEFKVIDLQNENIEAKWLHEKWNKILLDPPRSGAKEIMPVIAKLVPEVIVYISCNPATLARDANILVNHNNYTCSHLGVMDMFPHTTHIESMAVFIKNKKPSKS